MLFYAQPRILTDCMQTNEQFLIKKLSELIAQTSRKTKIIAAIAAFFTLCTFGAIAVAPLVADPSDLPIQVITYNLALPDLSNQLVAQEKSSTQQYFASEETVRPGDTLAALFSRLGVRDDDAINFIKTDKIARRVLQLTTGKRLQANTTGQGKLVWLNAILSDKPTPTIQTVTINKKDDTFVATQNNITPEVRVEMSSGDITSSLFAATDKAQLPDSVAKEMVSMFSTKVDFASDLYIGDHFSIVYETYWHQGTFLGNGRILAGEFNNKGVLHQAVWFQDTSNNKNSGYYDMNGRALKKAFLRSPIEFSRISSGFSMRTHPISGQWKQHQGVDFAASVGTPIRASGDGIVNFIGKQHGYGNVILIKHANNYETVYAHASRFARNIQRGSKVQQGDIIAYVGSTGFATGPHLHYEFRINHVAVDPTKINIGAAQNMTASQMKAFKNTVADIAHRFALLRAPQENTAKLALSK